jgi:hypothetical protein
MNIKELLQRLREIGIDIDVSTLRRWADKGLITNHVAKSIQTGRGHQEEWLEDSFFDAAAFWGVRHCGITKSFSTKEIEEVKARTRRLFESPDIFFESPSELTTITPPSHIFDVQTLEFKVQDTELNNLAVAWIAAREKARRCKTTAKRYGTRRLKKARHHVDQKKKFSKRVEIIVDWFYNPRYSPRISSSKLIPQLDDVLYRADLPKKMANKIDYISQQLIQQLDKDERKRVQVESEKMRFVRGEPRLKPSYSHKDELVVFLHSYQ